MEPQNSNTNSLSNSARFHSLQNGDCALGLAAFHKHAEVIRFLRNRGIGGDCTDTNSVTPSFSYPFYRPLEKPSEFLVVFFLLLFLFIFVLPPLPPLTPGIINVFFFSLLLLLLLLSCAHARAPHARGSWAAPRFSRRCEAGASIVSPR